MTPKGSFWKGGALEETPHGYTELAEDGLSAKALINGINKAIIIEQYLEYPKGPCLLLLQKGESGSPIHAVWGIPRNQEKPAVLITAYKPDPLPGGYKYERKKKN